MSSKLEGRKVTNVRMHVGVQVGAQVVTSLDAEKDGADMEVTDVGIYVKSTRRQPNKSILIPYSHVGSAELAPEGAAPAAKAAR